MSKALVASVKEHGDHIYITCPVGPYLPDQAEIETFAFASDVRSAAPNPKILWLKGQYVEADAANRNADQWTAGELAIKKLTPVLMPITVMHDLRSAVGTIADAKLLTPEADQVPRARLDTMLAVWAHRFPEVAAEAQANAAQNTLMQSMECLSPYYDCSLCGTMLARDRYWEKTWKEHVANHSQDVLSSGRSPARTLRNVTFTGVGLIFGTRGARGAMPDAHLEVEELAAMHREAHAPQSKRPRRKNVMELDDTKYEGMISAKADADSKISTLTAEAAEKDRKIEELEGKLTASAEAVVAEKKRADDAEEKSRVAAMRDERIGSFGAPFAAALSKREITHTNVKAQAAVMSDEDWTARVKELEEALGLKVDAAAAPANDPAGSATAKELPSGLFTKEQVASSQVGQTTEVTASAGTDTEPSVEARQSAMRGLIRPRSKAKA